MPAPTFPNYVFLARKSIGHQRGNALQRTPTDLGLVKQTRVLSRVLVQRPFSYYVYTQANYNSFMTWFRDTVNEGATWFDWTDPVDGATKSARIVGGSLKDSLRGQGFNNWLLAMTIETWSA
jgi:hypothetical protein